MMISTALFTWDWRFWGPFHPRVQKLKRRAHFATVQHLTVRPRERQHQDPQNQSTAQLQSRHYESKCAQKIEIYGVKKGFLVIDLITNAKEERRNDLRWLKWTESDVLDSAAASLKWVWGESWGALHLHLINTQTSCSQIKGTFPCKRDCAIYTWLLHYSKGTDYGRAWYLTLSLKLKLWFWQEARYESRALLRSCAHGDQDQIWVHFKWTFLRLGLQLSYKPI